MNVLKKAKKANRNAEKVTPEILERAQILARKLDGARMRLGDMRLEEIAQINYIQRIQMQRAEHAQEVAEKYGTDAVIDLETGEIKRTNGKD